MKDIKEHRTRIGLRSLSETNSKYYSIALILLVIIGLTNLTEQVPTCNSFPKIFGGSGQNSYLYHIDEFADYLAMVGETYDTSLAAGLASGPRYPFIAVTSVAIPETYYWAKVLSLKGGTQFEGVQYSNDGALLIAHSQQSTSNEYIVIFNAKSGAVLSARSYSSNGYQNYNLFVKSMVISSGASPMAYILSNNYDSTNGCTGQHLFKLDPATITSSWTKITINITNCGHLGLTFGRSESVLYAFSWFNSLSTVSLLDTAGNSIWQYSTTGGDQQEGNLIQYKAIDAATDMIIATSGLGSSINYNRIISSTSSYSLVHAYSETYRHIALGLDKRLRGLFIIEKDYLVALIWDKTSYQTDVAALNLATPSVTYKPQLPLISNMYTAVFVSASVYYTASCHLNFYKDYTNQVNLNGVNNQGIVYSSDMSSSSCYTIQTSAATGPSTLSTFSITSIPTSIYEPSTITFNNDYNAYTTVDIIQSALTKIDRWCPRPTYSAISSSQMTGTTLIVKYQTGEQVFPITAFSATASCGNPIFKYRGSNSDTQQTLVYSNDLISIDPLTGNIKVNSKQQEGTYQIKLEGILPDLLSKDYVTFKIIISSKEPLQPSFQTQPKLLEIIEVMAGIQKHTFYQLPVDSECNGCYVTHNPPLPRFIQFEYPVYKFRVVDKKDCCKQHQIKGKLINEFGFVPFSFSVNVTNEAPKFSVNSLKDKQVPFGYIDSYSLPNVIDREKQQVNVIANRVNNNGLPPFIQFDEKTCIFTISPTNQEEIKTHQIQVDLIDQFDAKTSYILKIVIIDIPLFNFTNKLSQNLAVKKKTNFTKSGIKTNEVKIKISKITQNQEATIKIINSYNNNDQNELIQKVTNETIKLSVESPGNKNYNLKYEIIQKDQNTSSIQILIYYPSLSRVSSSQVPDKLQLKVLEEIQTIKNQRLIVLKENTKASGDIPPQYIGNLTIKIANNIQDGRFSFTKIKALNIFIALIIQYTWSRLEDLSFLTLNSMIAILVPGIPGKIQSAMINLIYFDIFYPEEWFPDIFKYFFKINLEDGVQDDEPVSFQFLEFGFESYQFINNSGSSFIYIISFIVAWLILLLLILLSYFSINIHRLRMKIQRLLIWDQSINFLLNQFSPLTICCLINLLDMRFSNKEKISFFSSIIVISVLTFLGFGLIALILATFFESKFTENYPRLNEGLKSPKKNKLILFWKPINLLRQLLTYIVVLKLINYPPVQIILLLLISIAQQFCIIAASPYKEYGANFMNFLNELAVSGSLYIMLCLISQDPMRNEQESQEEIQIKQDQLINIRAQISWVMAILIISTILINIIFSFGHIAVYQYRKIKGRCKAKDQNSSEKYAEQLNKEETRIEDNSVIENEKRLIEVKTKLDHDVIVEDIVEEDKESESSQKQPKVIDRSEKPIYYNQQSLSMQINEEIRKAEKVSEALQIQQNLILRSQAPKSEYNQIIIKMREQNDKFNLLQQEIEQEIISISHQNNNFKEQQIPQIKKNFVQLKVRENHNFKQKTFVNQSSTTKSSKNK